MVPGLQGFDLLRESEGAEAEACGMDQAELISRLHHLIQTRHSGPHEVYLVFQNFIERFSISRFFGLRQDLP